MKKLLYILYLFINILNLYSFATKYPISSEDFEKKKNLSSSGYLWKDKDKHPRNLGFILNCEKDIENLIFIFIEKFAENKSVFDSFKKIKHPKINHLLRLDETLIPLCISAYDLMQEAFHFISRDTQHPTVFNFQGEGIEGLEIRNKELIAKKNKTDDEFKELILTIIASQFAKEHLAFLMNSLEIEKLIAANKESLPNLYAIYTHKSIKQMTNFVSSIDDIKDEVRKIKNLIVYLQKRNTSEKITVEELEKSIKEKIECFKENSIAIFLMTLVVNKDFFLKEKKMSSEKALIYIFLSNKKHSYYIFKANKSLKEKEKKIHKCFHFILKDKETSEYNKTLNKTAEKLIRKIDSSNLFKINNKEELKKFILKDVQNKLDSFYEKEIFSIDRKYSFIKNKKLDNYSMNKEIIINKLISAIENQNKKIKFYNKKNTNNIKKIDSYLKKSIKIYAREYLSELYISEMGYIRK